jgi:signal transduction histidine kinase
VKARFGLSARMSAVILAGVIALAALAHLREAHERMLAASQTFVIAVAGQLRAADRLISDHALSAAAVATTFGAPGLDVQLESVAPPPPPREWSHGADVRAAVLERSDVFRDGRIAIHFPLDRGRPPEPRIELTLARASGDFLVARTTTNALQSSRHAVSMSTLLAALAVAVAMLLFTRGALRHLRPFARAAESVGDGTPVTPLPENEGPREIRELAGAFNTMQRRIQTQLAERSLMLAAVSHDLRTFLTRFALRAEYIGAPEQRRKADADIAEMTALLDNLLAYARDTGRDEPFTRIDIATLLASLVADAEDLGHRVTYDGPAHLALRGRPVDLKRALGNVIDNAVRYGGCADVRLRSTEVGVRVVVADRGPGIPPEHRARVLAPFERLDGSRSRSTGGTGLGLAIAHTVIVRHGGTLTFADRPGGGLEVHVDLPVS